MSWALFWLAGQFEPTRAKAGDAIIAEGDPGDGLYVLLSGRLRVSVSAAPGAAGGEERVLHDLGRGAVIGEIALLSDRMRSATVRAVRDSDLLLLRTASFKALTEQLTGNGTTALLDKDAVDRELGPDAAQRGPSHPRRHELTGWLDAIERGHDHVVYLTDPEDTEWSRLCLSQSDVALLAGGTDPGLGPVEARALATRWLRCELVLVHRTRPGGTARWLAERPVADYHHVRDGQPRDTERDVARLARMVDLLLHPPVPAIGVLDFKAGAALIETGYRHAAEALADSGIPGRFR